MLRRVLQHSPSQPRLPLPSRSAGTMAWVVHCDASLLPGRDFRCESLPRCASFHSGFRLVGGTVVRRHVRKLLPIMVPASSLFGTTDHQHPSSTPPSHKP